MFALVIEGHLQVIRTLNEDYVHVHCTHMYTYMCSPVTFHPQSPTFSIASTPTLAQFRATTSGPSSLLEKKKLAPARAHMHDFGIEIFASIYVILSLVQIHHKCQIYTTSIQKRIL